MITILKLIKFDKKKRTNLGKNWWDDDDDDDDDELSTYSSKRNVMIKHWSLDQKLKECLAKSPKDFW